MHCNTTLNKYDVKKKKREGKQQGESRRLENEKNYKK